MIGRLLAAAAVLFFSAPAWGQAPGITSIFPPGGQAGTSVQSTLTGTNLGDVRAVLVSGGGVKVEKGMGGNATTLPLQISIDPSAEIGLREVRVVTANGSSNAGRIWVGRYPDLPEKEPNDVLAQPQQLEKVPVTLVGRSDKAEDVDAYAFTAGAGETWVFAINAARHFSAMDGYLSLLDERGRVQAYAMDAFERDPRLIHTFKNGGRYVLQVRDSLYKGGPNYTYRLTIGRIPVVTRWSPMGGRRGSTVTVSLSGVNLDQMSQVQVAIPNEPVERVRVVPKTPAGPANPIDLFPTDFPEAAEKEPNDAREQATRPGAFPVVVTGHIQKDRDRDVFAFKAEAKQVVYLDVHAKRLDSRLDPVMRVLDAAGKELANNDDGFGKDARLSFTAPAAGDYFVEVRSLSTRGGDDYFYRLEMTTPPPPDFALKATPDNPTVPSGAAVPVTVTAQRAGYNDEIAIRVDNLPPGVTASPAVIRKGQNSVVLTLTSAAGTQPAHSALRIVGTGKAGDRTLERVASGQERYQPPLANAQQARMRDVEMILTAIGPQPPYLLAVTAPATAVKAGAKLELTVKVTRKEKYEEPVQVTVLGLPPNVKAAALTIAKDKTEGKLTLEAAGNAPVGPASVVVQGNAKNVLVAAPALSLTIEPMAKAEKK